MHFKFVLGFLIFICVFQYFESSPNFNKRNVVIFFTKPNVDSYGSIDDSGIQFLKFPVNGVVQSCDNNIPKQYQNLFSINPKCANCNAIFNKYLMDLIEWSTLSKHMVSATISSTDSDSYVVQRSVDPDHFGTYKKFKYSINLPPEVREQSRFDGWSESEPLHYFEQIPSDLRKSERGLPPLAYESYKDFPIVSAYNPIETNEDRNREGSYYENDEITLNNLNEESHPKEDIQDLKAMFYGTESEDNAEGVKKKKINEELDDEKKLKKSKLDFFSPFTIFYKIKDLFKSSFLNPNYKRDVNAEENSVDASVLGTIQDNPMFDLVKSTVNSLKQQSSEYSSKIQGFLLVVLGGKLSEISNPFSDLVQSIKYVFEHTRKKDTLILVTCYCPDRGNEQRNKRQIIPFYARGLNSEDFQDSVYMWDILGKMKDSIKHVWGKGKSNAHKIMDSMTKNKTTTTTTTTTTSTTTTPPPTPPQNATDNNINNNDNNNDDTNDDDNNNTIDNIDNNNNNNDTNINNTNDVIDNKNNNNINIESFYDDE